jgi:Family of unknown function (DUF6518)
MSRSRKLGLLLLAAIAFGALVAAFKGQDTGVRDTLGNTSAPWVLVPFLAGALYTRIWQAALVGVVTTLAAFFGFYLAEAAILDLGPHPWTTDLRLTLGSGHAYEVWGMPVGFVYGVVGGLWKSGRLPAAPVAVGIAFISEPLIVAFLNRQGIWAGDLLEHPLVWASEVLVGVAVVAYAVAHGRTRTARG